MKKKLKITDIDFLSYLYQKRDLEINRISDFISISFSHFLFSLFSSFQKGNEKEDGEREKI